MSIVSLVYVHIEQPVPPIRCCCGATIIIIAAVAFQKLALLVNQSFLNGFLPIHTVSVNRTISLNFGKGVLP